MSIAGSRVAQRYTLVRPLGRGSFSVVYLALDDAAQPYAVKIFPAALRQHADHEARMQIKNPALGEVLLLSEFQGQPAVVLRFVRGQPLFERYHTRPACRHEFLAYQRTLDDVLSGLQAMHAGGLLHRDVKPDNILVGQSGQARLIDFDLSGPSGEGVERPQRIGTAAYQSPEAGRGEVLGPPSDLYSVGVLLHWGLYASLPGEEPRSGEGRLAQLCLKLLAADPQTRPSAAATRVELKIAASWVTSGFSAP